jgi:glycosyltransferase involved in cell wall biosynthesis
MSAKANRPIKVLVLGQTPPPFGGQAMMIQRLVNAKFQHVEIIHVRMAFSDSFRSVGGVSLRKMLHIPHLIIKTIYKKFQRNVNVLYYPPAGPNLNPILRDFVLLFFVRPFFDKTIFHFRAAGVSEYLARAPIAIRLVGNFIYRRPDAAIQLSALNPPDGAYFNSRKIFIIRNGLEDAAASFVPIARSHNIKINILYTGVVTETKGILTIVDTAKLLKERGLSFNITCIGDFSSHAFEETVRNKCRELGVENCVSFPGVKTGHEKWQYFMKADLFCFPSYFEAESFGNVLVEAMMFELPVVATRWRGIPDIVDDGETGLLVPVQHADALAKSIMLLAGDSDRRVSMGRKGRQKFLSHFLLESHLSQMEQAFVAVASDKNT